MGEAGSEEDWEGGSEADSGADSGVDSGVEDSAVEDSAVGGHSLVAELKDAPPAEGALFFFSYPIRTSSRHPHLTKTEKSTVNKMSTRDTRVSS